MCCWVSFCIRTSLPLVVDPVFTFLPLPLVFMPVFTFSPLPLKIGLVFMFSPLKLTIGLIFMFPPLTLEVGLVFTFSSLSRITLDILSVLAPVTYGISLDARLVVVSISSFDVSFSVPPAAVRASVSASIFSVLKFTGIENGGGGGGTLLAGNLSVDAGNPAVVTSKQMAFVEEALCWQEILLLLHFN